MKQKAKDMRQKDKCKKCHRFCWASVFIHILAIFIFLSLFLSHNRNEWNCTIPLLAIVILGCCTIICKTIIRIKCIEKSSKKKYISKPMMQSSIKY